jgi:hypothetical protein
LAINQGTSGYCPDQNPNVPDDRLELRGSYLLWWISRSHNGLPLLTTGGAGNGALGASDTVILLRAGDVGGTGPYSGGEFGLHYWLDPEQTLGLDARFFFLGQRDFHASAGGDANGTPLLSIPFKDLNPQSLGNFTQVAFPGAVTGSVHFDSQTQLWGMEINGDTRLISGEASCLKGLLGFRYADLFERFTINQNVTSVAGQQLLSFKGNPMPATDSLSISDDFRTRNHFYGGNLGLEGEYHVLPHLVVGATAKLALGWTRGVLDVGGSTAQLSPGQAAPVATAPGGLFALPGNIGRFTHDRFSVLPELDVKARWAVTEHLQLSVGYSFLFWSNVLRPADQINGSLNSSLAPSQVPFGAGGPLNPVPSFHRSDLYIHGINAGVELRF